MESSVIYSRVNVVQENRSIKMIGIVTNQHRCVTNTSFQIDCHGNVNRAEIVSPREVVRLFLLLNPRADRAQRYSSLSLFHFLSIPSNWSYNLLVHFFLA